MGKEKRRFIIEELMVPGFIEKEGQEIFLEERDKSGKSELRITLTSGDNLCIANIDKKNTDCLFFQKGKEKSLYKRVDHMIFEQQSNDTWKLHLIEMKNNVGGNTWQEIKGKFRSSYLIAQAIAGMLDIRISAAIMYTTYEKVYLTPLDTMPTARRVHSGESVVPMSQEWEGEKFSLNFGEQLPFLHIPIHMERDENGVLTGKWPQKKPRP